MLIPGKQFGDLAEVQGDGMTGKRLLIPSLCILLLPIMVSLLEISSGYSALLVVLVLLLTWFVILSGLVKPASLPELELCTFPGSHFVEKVRWSMDLLGLEYRESPMVATLGAFFLGRTVPQLKIKTGMVRSVIGNSPDILRYLWGCYGTLKEEKALFLLPSPELLDLEKRLDRYGAMLQVWVYYHLAHERRLTLRLWGRYNPHVPRWQRLILVVLYPVLRFLILKSFRISPRAYKRAKKDIEDLLEDLSNKLRIHPDSLSSGSALCFVDVTFAALSGLWVMPEGYGGKMADSIAIDASTMPALIRDDIELWNNQYPEAVEFVKRLYRQHRQQ
ncbi:MAG: hypothetical protein CMP10_12705 [Zetaproteobacteria bacterium]|nr:hypothetical protein [Pseudobdellovibrionaceae bacterium]